MGRDYNEESDYRKERREKEDQDDRARYARDSRENRENGGGYGRGLNSGGNWGSQGYENESYKSQRTFGDEREYGNRGSKGPGSYGPGTSYSGGGSSGGYRTDRTPQEDHRGKGPKGYKRSDERIREDINDRLTEEPNIDASEVEVECSEGEITLSGMVYSREAKRLAEDVAEAVSGVKNVQNNIRVKGRQESEKSGEDYSASSSSKSSKSSGTPATAYQQSKSRQQTQSGS